MSLFFVPLLDFPESRTSSKNSLAAFWPEEVAKVGWGDFVRKTCLYVCHAEVVCLEKHPGAEFHTSGCKAQPLKQSENTKPGSEVGGWVGVVWGRVVKREWWEGRERREGRGQRSWEECEF